MNDMTKGKPFSLLLRFCIPILIGNVFQQLYNVVDSIIVGRFEGVNSLAAVGATGSIVFFVYGWIVGMTSGFAILIAQSYGAADESRMKKLTSVSIYLCIAIAVLLTGALLIANSGILSLMNTPKEIFAESYAYIKIIYIGMAATVAYNLLSCILRALGNSRIPLYILIIASIMNVVLDLIFVGLLSMGVIGAGIATVISQCVSVILSFIYLLKNYTVFCMTKEEAAFELRTAGRLLSIGIPMGLQFSITAIGVMIVQSSLNALGTVYIAAYSAAGKIQNIFTIPFSSLGVALSTYTGQNMGAGKIPRIKEGVNACIKLALSWSVVAIVIVLLFGNLLVRGFVSDTTGQVVETAQQYFRISVWFYPFLSLIFIYRNTLQGLGDGLVPMLGGVFELAARAVVILLLVGRLGFTGICLTDPVAWISALIPLVPIYYRKMGRLIPSSELKQ